MSSTDDLRGDWNPLDRSVAEAMDDEPLDSMMSETRRTV